MAKYKSCGMEEKEKLCALGKALSSPERLDILGLLSERDMIIAEIAKELNLQVSSTAFHLKVLEQAGLVRLEDKPGTRGNQKRCICMADRITIDLMRKNTELREIFSAEMPVGAFSSCQVTPTCGLRSEKPSGQKNHGVHGNLFRSAGIPGRLEIRHHGVDQRLRLRNLDQPRRFWRKAGTPDTTGTFRWKDSVWSSGRLGGDR